MSALYSWIFWVQDSSKCSGAHEGWHIKVYIGFRDQIFPFSENWPANYNFSLFSKLPTNYPKNSEKTYSVQKTYVSVIPPPYFRLFFEHF